MRWTGFIILTASILMITGAILPEMNISGENPPSRAPAIVKGHISSNQNWNDNISGYALDNVVIDEGVTVTVGPGVPLYFYQNSFFYIEGNLIVNGLEGDTVEFKSLLPESTWGQFFVNSTGQVNLQNFSINDRSNVAIGINGEDCVLKNGVIYGGFQNIFLESDGGHLIENMDLYDSFNFGISLYGNEKMTYARNINVHDPGAGAIATGSSNGTFENINCNNSTYYGLYSHTHSKNIIFRNFNLTWPEFKNNVKGLYVANDNHEVLFEKGTVDNCGTGIFFERANEGSDAVFRNVRIGNTVKRSAVSVWGGHLEATFIDCSLMGSEQTISLNATDGSQEVRFVNTTWERSSPVELLEGAYLNISWHLDIDVTDANHDPLNTSLRISHSGGGPPAMIDMPEGKLRRYRIMDRSMRGGFRTSYYPKDYRFQAVEDPDNTFRIEDKNIDNHTRWDIILDLKPKNDMPESIQIDEDTTHEFNLNENFTDPEGLPMEFDITQSPDLEVVQDENNITLKNKEPDWYGTAWILITATDTGLNTTQRNVTVNITPVNDAPVFTEDIPVLSCEEEGQTYFNFSGIMEDAEGDDIDLSLEEVENCQVEYNSTTMNLTLIPEEDFHGLIEIGLNLTDGEDWNNEVLVLNVTPVNDAPIFNAPGEWNITIGIDLNETIELGSMISDPDGDDLTITVSPDEYASVNGTVLELIFDDSFTGSEETLEITVSDGTESQTAILTVHMEREGDDDETNLGTLEVTSEDDGWKFEVEGSEEQTLYIVIEDGEGSKKSYPMEYDNGIYSVDIPDDEAQQGFIYWLSDSENGEPMEGTGRGSLQGEDEADDDDSGDMGWLIVLIVAVLVILAFILFFAMKGRGMDIDEE